MREAVSRFPLSVSRRALMLAVVLFAGVAAVAQQTTVKDPPRPAKPKVSMTVKQKPMLKPMDAPEPGDSLKLPPYRKVKLKNGLTLMLLEQHEVPIISFSFLVRSGGVNDPAGKDGLASITAGLLRKGTKARTAQQIADELDFVGGTFDASVDADTTTGRSEFLKKDINKGLELLLDILLNASFPQSEFEKLVKQRIDGIKADKDDASAVIGTYYNAFLFGGHPYGRPTGGDERTLAGLKREDVAAFYSTNYVPGNVILAAVGDFDSAAMETMLTDRFGAWPAKQFSVPRVTTPAPVVGKRLLFVDKPDLTQTFYYIGNVGIARTNPDRVPVQLVNTLFGGRFTSQLNAALRIESGLTYGARSSFDRRREPGPFMISSYTRNDATEKALDMTLDLLKRLHEKGISEEELKSAKAYIKGQYPPRIETTDQLASLLVSLEYYGLDQREIDDFYAKIDAVTLEDTKRVIQQYFPMDNLVFVMVGKGSDVGNVVKKYAPSMKTVSITAPGFGQQ